MISARRFENFEKCPNNVQDVSLSFVDVAKGAQNAPKMSSKTFLGHFFDILGALKG